MDLYSPDSKPYNGAQTARGNAMDDRMLLRCWNVLTRTGWRDFTLSCVILHHPEYSMHELETRFPSTYHLVTAYCQYQLNTVSPPTLDGIDGPLDLNEGLFQSVITIIEVWWPYREMMKYAILDMPLDVMMSWQWHTISWLYLYWQHYSGQELVYFDMFKGFWRIAMVVVSFFLYVWIFPYALTHNLDQLWARLDYASTVIIDWLKKVNKPLDFFEFFDIFRKVYKH